MTEPDDTLVPGDVTVESKSGKSGTLRDSLRDTRGQLDDFKSSVKEFAQKLPGQIGKVVESIQARANAITVQVDDETQNKIDSLVAMVGRLQPRYNMVVTHVGIDDAELGALLDMNTSGGLAEMSKNRQGELDALTSSRFREAITGRNVQLITYRQLIEMQGLKAMTRPGG